MFKIKVYSLFILMHIASVLCNAQALDNPARGRKMVATNFSCGLTAMSLVVDGYLTTYCTSSPATGKYFILKMPFTYTFSSAQFYFGTYYPTSITVYGSADSITYSTLGTASPTSSNVTMTLSTSYTNNKYVKIVMNNSTYNNDLLEFELVGTSNSSFSINYDNGGNRYETKIITLGKKSARLDTATSKDTTVIEKIEDVIFTDDASGKKVNLFPNPVKEKLKITFEGYNNLEGTSIQVFDISGHQVLMLKRKGEDANIDFSAYPSGMYILRITLDNKPSEWKIVKE